MNDNTPVQDSIEAFVLKMETFATEFRRMASTPEQAKLSSQFSHFVETMSPGEIAKAAMPAIVRDYQSFAHQGPGVEEPEM